VAARLEARSQWGWLDAGAAHIEGNEVTAWDYLCDGCEGPARRWYRLAVAAPIGLARTDSVSLSTVFPPPLLLIGARPNPSLDGRPRLEFTLPSAGTVWLEVFDPAGRRVANHEFPALDTGPQILEIAPGTRLRAGVYFVRLRFGAERRTARLVVLN